MALLIYGKTQCPLCGKVLNKGQEVVGFPAFLKSTHALARYSDSTFHLDCFAKCADKDAVKNLFIRYRQIWESRPKKLKSMPEIEAWGKMAFKEFE